VYHPPSLQEKCQGQPDDTPEEATYAVADGCVPFTRKCKYLGSAWITQDLGDYTDIAARIGKQQRKFMV
jgi:hypothetical protein